MLVQGPHSLVEPDTGLHIQAEGLSPGQMHRSAEVGILPVCQAEVEAAAGAQGGLVGPAVLEAGGCSGPLKWEASEQWEVGDLSDKGMAGMEEVAAEVAWGLGMGQRQVRLEEDQEVEKTLAEKKEAAPWVGRSPGQVEVGQTQRQAG